MAFTIDTSTDFGKRVKHRLEHEQVAWLTTVDGNGRPFPSPDLVLYEDDGTLLIYSQPNKTKLRNIASNAAVVHQLQRGRAWRTMSSFSTARRSSTNPRIPPPITTPIWRSIDDGIASIDMTPESFSAEFSVPIRVILQKVRGH